MVIKNNKDLIKFTKYYFGKDNTRIIDYLKSVSFNDSRFDVWLNFFESVLHLPVDVTYGIFQDVTDLLNEKRYGKIDWEWIGDLSWIAEIPLIKGLKSALDFDKQLAIKNGGQVRFMKVFISDIIPAYTYDLYCMTYENKDEVYGFKPVRKINSFEKKAIKLLRKAFSDLGYHYVSRNTALKKYRTLYSDINREGNASIFDVLFNDLYNYQDEYLRYSTAVLTDPVGNRVSWRKYYYPNGNLKYSEEYRHYLSKNVECVVTDHKGRIDNIKVWRDIPGNWHKEFELDILKKIKHIKKY